MNPLNAEEVTEAEKKEVSSYRSGYINGYRAATALGVKSTISIEAENISNPYSGYHFGYAITVSTVLVIVLFLTFVEI